MHWREAFPGLVSYNRFVEWMPSALLPLCVYLKHCFGTCTGISFIDSSSLKVCHNRRIRRHKVFRGLAARGKTSVDWFFGFKLHLVVNDQGELLNIQITPGNTDDRKPVDDLLKDLHGKVFADRGYVSTALAQRLFETYGIEFFAKPKRNMKNHLMRLLTSYWLANAPLSKPSLTSSKTSPRLSILGIAAPSTLWSMSSVA